jgi:hypothetical protein
MSAAGQLPNRERDALSLIRVLANQARLLMKQMFLEDLENPTEIVLDARRKFARRRTSHGIGIRC